MLEKTTGILSSSGSAVKGLAGAHPIALGVVVGIGAYYAISKYWLNKDEDEELEVEPEESEATA